MQAFKKGPLHRHPLKWYRIQPMLFATPGKLSDMPCPKRDARRKRDPARFFEWDGALALNPGQPA
jgi:hypothetical protein